MSWLCRCGRLNGSCLNTGCILLLTHSKEVLCVESASLLSHTHTEEAHSSAVRVIGGVVHSISLSLDESSGSVCGIGVPSSVLVLLNALGISLGDSSGIYSYLLDEETSLLAPVVFELLVEGFLQLALSSGKLIVSDA